MADNSDKVININSSRPRPYKLTIKRAKVTGILCLVIVCVALVFMSPIFSIKTIIVNHGEYLDAQTILNSLGFAEGDNIFAINVSDAKKHIESMDRVSECIIERSLSGKVVVTVNDVTECGYIKMNSGYAGMDENGRIVIITDKPESGIPVVLGYNIGNLQKGDYIKTDEKNSKEKTEFLIRIMSSLKKQSLISKVKSLDVTDLKNVSLILNTDTLVNFGEDGKDSVDRIEYKVAFLKGILDSGSSPKSGGVIELYDTSKASSSVT